MQKHMPIVKSQRVFNNQDTWDHVAVLEESKWSSFCVNVSPPVAASSDGSRTLFNRKNHFNRNDTFCTWICPFFLRKQRKFYWTMNLKGWLVHSWGDGWWILLSFCPWTCRARPQPARLTPKINVLKTEISTGSVVLKALNAWKRALIWILFMFLLGCGPGHFWSRFNSLWNFLYNTWTLNVFIVVLLQYKPPTFYLNIACQISIYFYVEKINGLTTTKSNLISAGVGDESEAKDLLFDHW